MFQLKGTGRSLLPLPASPSRPPITRIPARRRLLLSVPRRLALAVKAELRIWKETYELAPVLDRVREYTMLPDAALIQLARQVRDVVAEGVPGDLVECGVWRGGAAFLMADVLLRAGVHDRRVWLFDSFAGLPQPSQQDGARAMAFMTDVDNPWFLDSLASETSAGHSPLRASLEDVQRSAEQLRLSRYMKFVKGWFEETLPTTRQRVGPIALLRIDADWYESVTVCLEQLYDQVSEGGLVILDDYYDWEGCAVAVHEFLGKRRVSHRILVAGDKAFFRRIP
jgi:O-methyltransferase